MSLLSPERVLVSLAPAAVHAVQLRGRKIVAQYEAPAGRSGWQRAIEVFTESSCKDLRGDVAVVLSNAFVRYAVVPHAGELSRADERIALARAQFAKVYGDRVREWEVRVAPCARGEPGLALAVDAALVEAVKHCFSGKRGLRLASLQPYLMSAFNQWRGRVADEGAWFVLLEPERSCVALLDGRRWLGVSVTRESAPLDLNGLVERERARMAVSGPATVLANVDDGPYALALSAR